MPSRLAVLVLALALLGGCNGRPPTARGWNACVQKQATIMQIGPEWEDLPGTDEVLTLRSFWSTGQGVTRAARSGVLKVRLPAGPRAGESVVLGHEAGFYIEDGAQRTFDSTDLIGGVQYIVVTPSRFVLKLDLLAMNPTVDLDGQGLVSFTGVVDAPRVRFPDCARFR